VKHLRRTYETGRITPTSHVSDFSAGRWWQPDRTDVERQRQAAFAREQIKQEAKDERV
jgi:hypothetical protein